MKPCYEGMKEIGVDMYEIWRKILGFSVSIGLLPLDLKEIGVDVDKIWKKMYRF